MSKGKHRGEWRISSSRSRADAGRRRALKNREPVAVGAAVEAGEWVDTLPEVATTLEDAAPEAVSFVPDAALEVEPEVEELPASTAAIEITAEMLAALAPPADPDAEDDGEIDQYSLTSSSSFFETDTDDVTPTSLFAMPPVQLPVPIEPVEDWENWNPAPAAPADDDSVADAETDIVPEIPAWSNMFTLDPIVDAADPDDLTGTPNTPSSAPSDDLDAELAFLATLPAPVVVDEAAGELAFLATLPAPVAAVKSETASTPAAETEIVADEPTVADDPETDDADADEIIDAAVVEVVEAVDAEAATFAPTEEQAVPVDETADDEVDVPEEPQAVEQAAEVSEPALPAAPALPTLPDAPTFDQLIEDAADLPAMPVFGESFTKAAPMLPDAVVEAPAVPALAPIIVQLTAPAAPPAAPVAPAAEQTVQVVYVDGPAPAATAPAANAPVLPAATPSYPGLPSLPILPSNVDDTPFTELPDLARTPVSLSPAKKKKEPMFTWRGKPLGGSRDDEPTLEVRQTKRGEGSLYTPKKDFDPAVTDNIDTRTWFQDAMGWAMDRNASDVHIVLDGKTGILTARARIDGILRPFATIDGVPAKTVMGIFKTAAGMHSVSSFIPEESLYKIDVDGEERTARAAMARDHTDGNALVLRLPSTGAVKRLEELGFSDANLATVKKMLRSANRMLIFAGPMGAGKTSTAHGALLEVATPERSVWSIEDPVERNIPGVVQIQADEENKAGFAEMLPFLVRSDYDTLFLGEIRDEITAAAGVRQSKAGRQVISTIHAEDNIIALYRLIELADDTPLSCMSAVRGIVSQRLLRRLNPEWNGVDPDEKYKGRIPIHEILTINDELTEAVIGHMPLSVVREIADRASTSTFKTDSQRLIDAGITDLDEVNRVLGADQ